MTGSDDLFVPVKPTVYESYPFPLSTGQIAHLMLPKDVPLSIEDAERLAEYVEALAQ